METEQYEEQWRLIFAENERDALRQARELAGKEAAVFPDRHGRIVSWKLLAIKDLQETSLEHGTLLFSVIREAEPVAAPVWEGWT
jgi:hypothetical protein